MTNNPTPADPEKELENLLRNIGSYFYWEGTESAEFQQSYLDEYLPKLQSLIDAARKEVIDKVFELSPTAQFKDWKPQDALAFYERLKAYEQELSHPAPATKSDKE